MSFLPGEIELSEYENNEIKEYKDYILDPNTMKFKGIGNTEVESLREWVREALSIERYKYSIFPYEYGNEIETLIGTETLDEEDLKYYVETYITEALMVNQYIANVTVSNIKLYNNHISCIIIIDTVYGEKINYEHFI